MSHTIKRSFYSPMEIEQESFRIIGEEIERMDCVLDKQYEMVIKRVIHTTADFSYLDSLYFSDGVMELAKKALAEGTEIVTDTNMAKAGIHQKALEKLGGKVYCYMADPSVAKEAAESGVTRAVVSMKKSAKLNQNLIYVIGNAPTALFQLADMIREEKICPKLIIAAPVGFVNVVEAKEEIIETGVPCIVTRGRKGGSNVAAAIVNALLYETAGRD